MERSYADQLVSKTVYILREVKNRYKNPAIMCSWGKDSVTLLHVTKKAFFGTIPFPVIHIDTSYKFPEMYKFRDWLVKEWNIRLVIAKNDEALKNGTSPKTVGNFECCNLLKTQALKQCIEKNKFDVVLAAIRRDEHGIRNKEHYFSPRDKQFRWNTTRKKEGGDSGLESVQDPEFSGWNIYASYFGKDVDHIRCHPLLHWTEEDIWSYIKKENIKVNPLYFSKNGKRYRSLGCKCCTEPISSNAKNVNEILEELKKLKQGERAGRNLDKEELMERLRALGYM